MPTERLVLIGAGGHGKVVLDAYRLKYPDAVVAVRDDAVSKQGSSFLGLAIETPVGPLDASRSPCHIAIGDNAIRRRFAESAERGGASVVNVIHPGAIVAADAALGCGTFVAAGAVVAPGATIGAGAIVNHVAVVDHDCTVGDWCHIAPGAVLGGNVFVGANCLIGSGAVILPGVRIGARVVIGAGAVVTRDVPAGARIAGVPAKDL